MEPHICKPESRQGEVEQIANLFAPSLGKWRAESGERGEMASPASKDYIRSKLAGDIMLSVPIVGGNSILKRRDLRIDDVMISSHGDWQHKHLGAWQAVYGKTPYFQHLFPMLKEVYDNYSEGSLLDFNNALFRIAVDFLELDTIEESVKRLEKKNPELLDDLRRETLEKCDKDLTIFDSLFRLGKEAVFLFI